MVSVCMLVNAFVWYMGSSLIPQLSTGLYAYKVPCQCAKNFLLDKYTYHERFNG
jgi:hypothetical protein